jgi:tRNA(fMet)-specific endonuclease VapC
VFLLDTDTIVYALKGNKTVAHNLRRRLNDPMAISTISLMELYYGAYKSQRVAANLAKVRTIEQSFEIILIGGESADIFGMLKAELEKDGIRLDDFDIVIAACALSRNLTLVTNNEKHFQRIAGLKLENWAKGF